MMPSPATVRLRSGDEVVLRAPLADDAESLLVHLRRLAREFPEYEAYDAERIESQTVQKQAADLAEIARSPNRFLVSAFLNGTLVGNFGVERDRQDRCRHGGMLGIGVARDFQGLGIGTALLAHGLAQAADLEFLALRLKVRTTNVKAINLYEKMAFERVGLLKRSLSFPDGFADEYLYQKWLGREA